MGRDTKTTLMAMSRGGLKLGIPLLYVALYGKTICDRLLVNISVCYWLLLRGGLM